MENQKTSLSNNQIPYVLFADDDKDIIHLMQIYVGQLGWKAEYAIDATTMLDLVAKNSCIESGKCFDLIVADINFLNPHNNFGPRITGVTAGREIRKVHSDVPIVFVTAYNNSLIRNEVKKIDAYIINKPAEYNELFKWFYKLAIWHKNNHGSGLGITTTEGIWNTESVHRSEGSDAAMPKIIRDIFESVQSTMGPRPRWSTV